MTRPITDEELADVREDAQDEDWCAQCLGGDAGLNTMFSCTCVSFISIRSILARIDAAEGRT